MTPEEITHIIVGGAGAFITAALGVIAFLLRDAYSNIQRNFADLKQHMTRQDGHLSTQDGKLDALVTSRAEHGAAIVELKVRVAHLEAELKRVELRHDDFGGFLSSMGFRRRDMEPPSNPEGT